MCTHYIFLQSTNYWWMVFVITEKIILRHAVMRRTGCETQISDWTWSWGSYLIMIMMTT